jgi:sporulation protein YlmC with PRC-barrel domain
MVRAFTDDDRGKTVMTADGDTVGTVEDVAGDMAHVRPEADLSRSVRRRLGWTAEGEDVYELNHSAVSEITDDGIRLKRNP